MMESNSVAYRKNITTGVSIESKGTHHPISQSRTVLITRTVPGATTVGSSGGSIIRSESRGMSFMTPGTGRTLVNSGVSKFMEGRGKEKKDMQELNQRFGNYIEKTRFLEAQNRKLVTELAELREKWGKETERIKMLYETEMKQLRKLLDESEQAKGELQVRISSLEDHEIELQATIDDLKAQDQVHRETIDKLHQVINDLESEIGVLKRRVSKFDEERARDKKEMDRLRLEIQRLRKDLDAETLAHINAENEAQSCKDELEFLKEVHEAQLKELSNLACRDTTAENRDFWRAELAQALQEIQSEYDNKVEDMKSEMESVYSMKMQEFRTNNTRGNLENNHIKEENKRLKTVMQDLRDRVPMLEAKIASLQAQIQDLSKDLEEERRDHDLDNERLNAELNQTRIDLQQCVEEVQQLLDAKLSLELEIVAYRKLLDGEETRKGAVTRSFSMGTASRMSEVLPPTAPKPKMGAEAVIEGEIMAKTEKGQMSAMAANGGVSMSGSGSPRFGLNASLDDNQMSVSMERSSPKQVIFDDDSKKADTEIKLEVQKSSKTKSEEYVVKTGSLKSEKSSKKK